MNMVGQRQPPDNSVDVVALLASGKWPDALSTVLANFVTPEWFDENAKASDRFDDGSAVR